MTVLTLEADGLDPLDISDVGKVRSFDWASGAPRSVTEQAPDVDGEIDTTEFYGAGTITIGFRMVRVAYEAQLRRVKAFTYGQPTLTIDWEDGESPVMMATLSQGVVTSPASKASHRDAVVQFKVPRGVLESAELHQQVIRPGVENVAGLEFGPSLEFDLEFPAVDPPGIGLVTNAGDRPAYPVLRLYGPFGVEGDDGDETVIGNLTTGKELVIAGTLIAEGDYLEIDTRAKTVWVNGLDSQSRYDRLVFPDSDWWALTPGQQQEITFRPDTWSGNAQMHVLWRDAFS